MRLSQDSVLDACEVTIDSLGRRLSRMDAEFQESDHPRGQPKNAGQFVSKGGGSTRSTEAPAETPAKSPAVKSSAVKGLPSPEAQAEAASSLKSFVKIVAGHFPQAAPAIVFRHGQQFSITDQTYSGKRGQPQQCFKNAANLALMNPKYTYVEGYVAVHGVPIEHAWVVDEKGGVVDPTIRDPRGVGGYFGVPFRPDYVAKTLLKNRIYGMLGYHNRAIGTAHVHDYLAEAGGEQAEAGGEAKASSVDAPASSLLEGHSIPTVEEFNHSLTAGEVEWLEENNRRIAASTPTDKPVSEGGHREKDGTWTVERQDLHARIISHFLAADRVRAARPEAGEAPTFTVLGGRAGSGKSWVTRPGEGPVDAGRAIVVDNDEIKAMLPEYKGWNAGLVHEEASHLAERIIDIARQLKCNVVLDGTMRSFAPMRERLETFKRSGYQLSGYYVFASPETAARRAVTRGMRTGRYVPPAYVLSSTANERSFDALSGYFNNWAVYDNDHDEGAPRLKFSGSGVGHE